MKKLSVLPILLAVLLAASCQKDQEFVTLGACIDQPGKTYLNGLTPCWSAGDRVYVNDDSYSLTNINGSTAQIDHVLSAGSYRAIYPASIVTSGVDITNNGSNIPVTLPEKQTYRMENGHQRVDAPMGAYIEDYTQQLQFRNLCSIVHVMVKNSSGDILAPYALKISAATSKLSGTGTATVGTDNDQVTLSANASNSVMLDMRDANVTIDMDDHAAFDIYAPAFTGDQVTITLFTDGGYFDLSLTDVSLVPNSYTTVTLNVNFLTQPPTLLQGSTFVSRLSNYAPNATAVVFEYNSSVTSDVELQSSGTPIYGKLVGDTWVVSTSASMIYANDICASMFNGLSNLTSIDFGDGFNTSNVTTMNAMFIDCSRLSSLDLSSFNTSQVTNMGSMFDGCTMLTNLNLSHFNMEQVDYTGYMCYDLASQSSECTITCPSAVRTKLNEYGTYLPETVNFHWVITD